MAKTRKEVSTTAFDAVEEKVETTEVVENVKTQEAVENEVAEVKETPVEKTVESETKATSKDVKFYDDDIVKVKSVKRAGKTITATTGKAINFNEKGIAEVNGIDAKYLLSVPGFELA